MGFFYKHYNQSEVSSLSENIRDISHTLYGIYFTLLFSAIMALMGGVLIRNKPEHSVNSGFTFILTIWWLYYVNKHKQVNMFFIFIICSLFFGCTFTFFMSSFFSLDERLVIIFFGGVALLFCFHLFALRTHKIQVIYGINYFTHPLFILSMMISLKFVYQSKFPHDLRFIIPYAVAVPIVWHLGWFIFKDKIWIWGFWLPLHFHFLTVLSIIFKHHVIYLVGIYLFMLCILENLKLHSYDSITIAAHSDEHAPLPVSICITFFTEFLGRFSYMVIDSGRKLYQHLWNASHVVLGSIWQTSCTFFQQVFTFCGEVFDSCLLFIWISFDGIVTILEKVWNFVCAYISESKDNIRRIWDSIGLALCFIVFIVVFVTGVLR